TVTIVGAGTCTITATQGGSTAYSAATPVAQDVTILKADQTIAFGPLAGRVLGSAPFTVSAGSTSGLALAVSCLSTPCTVSGTIVTLVGAGTRTIAADQAGNGNYNAAPRVTQSIAIGTARFFAAGAGAGSSSLVRTLTTSSFAVRSEVSPYGS